MSRAPLPLRLLCLKAVLSLSDFEPDAAAVQCIHSVRNTCGISWGSQLQCLRGPTPRVPQGVPQARLQRRLFILFTGHLAVNFGQCPALHRHVNRVVTKHHQAQFQQLFTHHSRFAQPLSLLGCWRAQIYHPAAFAP